MSIKIIYSRIETRSPIIVCVSVHMCVNENVSTAEKKHTHARYICVQYTYIWMCKAMTVTIAANEMCTLTSALIMLALQVIAIKQKQFHSMNMCAYQFRHLSKWMKCTLLLLNHVQHETMCTYTQLQHTNNLHRMSDIIIIKATNFATFEIEIEQKQNMCAQPRSVCFFILYFFTNWRSYDCDKWAYILKCNTLWYARMPEYLKAKCTHCTLHFSLHHCQLVTIYSVCIWTECQRPWRKCHHILFFGRYETNCDHRNDLITQFFSEKKKTQI